MELNLTESRLAELWNLALSNEAPRGLLSANESLVLKQYQSINTCLNAPWYSAPKRALEFAKSIMPPTSRRFLIGKLIHPQPLLGFARGIVSQIQFESEEVQVRIQIEELPNGWRMYGRTSEPGWTIWSGSSNVACDGDGEFEFEVRSKSIEPLSLHSHTTTILLPMNLSESGDGSE